MPSNKITENSDTKNVKPHITQLDDGSYEIYKGDIKALYYVLIALVLSLGTVYFSYSGYDILSKILLACFIVVAILAVKIVLLKTVELKITDKFITVSLGKGMTEQILWEDIKGFREIRSNKKHYIAVDVVNPEEVIKSQDNQLYQKLLNMNMKLYNTPYALETDMLSAHSWEIISLLEDVKNEYREKEYSKSYF